jgi:hypothetical protein
MFDIVQFARDVHKNAVDHGWWAVLPDGTADVKSREFDEMMMLVSTELAEAMEEARKPGFKATEIYWIWNGTRYTHEEMSAMTVGLSGKPEGFPVELADAVIRMSETMAAFGHENWLGVDFSTEVGDYWFVSNMTMGTHLMQLTRSLSNIARSDPSSMKRFIAGCFKLAEINKIDLPAALKLKHEYNKTRPFRHGGKTA